MSRESAIKDCLECRLISGFGLIACAAYIYAKSKRPTKIESYAMKTLSAGFCGVGIARLLNMDFLKAKSEQN